MRKYTRKIIFIILTILVIPKIILADGVILAKTYKQNQQTIDISKYLVSEKYDGVRGFWNGKELVSRNKKIINAPDWFTKNLPQNIKLDGELWLGLGEFSKLSGIVRSDKGNSDWSNVKYMVFELPDAKGDFSKRYKQIQKIVKNLKIKHLKAVKQYKFTDNIKLNKFYKKVLAKGGEGVILHLATSEYHTGRSKDLLKYKPKLDAEAQVIGYTKGKGKYIGMVGALKVKTKDGVYFKVGSGLSDLDRKTPPQIGDIITYSYNSLTNKGKPRHPVFERVRIKANSKKTSKKLKNIKYK